jgi:hypothetical protein
MNLAPLLDMFSKVLIPYNPRYPQEIYNEYGYPTCPNDLDFSLKYCGITKERCRADRINGADTKRSRFIP